MVWMETKRQGQGEPRLKPLFLEGKGSSEVQVSDRDGKARDRQGLTEKSASCAYCHLVRQLQNVTLNT